MAAIPDRLARLYLDRLGVDATPGEVDFETLRRLHHAHLELVPYENLDIFRGQPPPIARRACVERIVGGRGGYCFHLNGAFSALLEWLDVDVRRHKAGVEGRGAVAPGANGNHLALTVGLDGKTYVVDVGLGDGPYDPLPLAFGAIELNGFRYELRRSSLAVGGWRLEHDPRGAFTGFDVAPGLVSTTSFVGMHRKLSRSPRSGFRTHLVIFRQNASRSEVLHGCVHARQTASRRTEHDVDDADEWWSLLIDGFGLSYGDLPARERRAVWRRVRASHEQWDAAGRP